MGPGWRLRLGGIALVVLAAALVVAGVANLGDDDATSVTAGVSSTSDAPTGTSSTVPTTTTSGAPTTPAPITPAPTAAAPRTSAVPLSPATTAPLAAAPAPTVAAPAPAASDPRARPDVVVLNNSTVTGLAARAADAARSAGWSVADVGNLTGRDATTTVYYPDGQERAARALATDVGADQVQPRTSGLSRYGDGLVLVVTNDYVG